MSGCFSPFAELHDRYYFTAEHEPCETRYQFDKALVEEENMETVLNVKDFPSYLNSLSKHDKFQQLLKYEKLEIVEKEDSESVYS